MITMLAVLINTIAVLIGSSIGLIANKAIPQSWNGIILKAMGLVSLYIGITGMLSRENTLVLVFSIAIGAIIGQALDIDGRFNRLSVKLEEKMDARFGTKPSAGTDAKGAVAGGATSAGADMEGAVAGGATSAGADAEAGEAAAPAGTNFAQGFITASLIFCVGAIAIVGPLNAALKGDADLLYTKSIMDGFTSAILAASLGLGVLFSAGLVLLIEGGIFLLAALVAPFLSTSVINEMTCAGSLVIIALGLNLLGATNLKVMNFIPAIFLPILFCPIYAWAAGLF